MCGSVALRLKGALAVQGVNTLNPPYVVRGTTLAPPLPRMDREFQAALWRDRVEVAYIWALTQFTQFALSDVGLNTGLIEAGVWLDELFSDNASDASAIMFAAYCRSRFRAGAPMSQQSFRLCSNPECEAPAYFDPPMVKRNKPGIPRFCPACRNEEHSTSSASKRIRQKRYDTKNRQSR